MMNQTQIQKVRYSHDAMIDLMISQPMISQNEIAATFGYTPAWVSTVINSDAFQAKFAERKAELVDPVIMSTVDERLRAVAHDALGRVLETLSVAPPAHALEAAKFATQALGYGARDRNAGGPAVQFVINMPERAKSSEAWEAKHGVVVEMGV